MDVAEKIAPVANTEHGFREKHAAAFEAAYNRGYAGLAPALESEECRANRFAYVRGWAEGRKRRMWENLPARIVRWE